MTRCARLALVLSLVCSAACEPPKASLASLDSSAVGTARVDRLAALRQSTDSVAGRTTPLAQWQLPTGLQEISGLALTRDGRMLVHGDEFGQIWEVDYRRGILVKSFTLGKDVLRDDFESIAVAGDDLYMLTSRGALYLMREAEDGQRVEFRTIDTGLAKECEFEAMTFDPTINSLLFACKANLNKALGDALTIFRWSLADSTRGRLSTLSVPFATVVGSNGWKEFHPSDIAIDPLTGNYVLVASIEKAIISITPQGAVVFARALPPGHQQAEGLTITRDSLMILADEAAKLPASISLYRWP